MRGCCKSESKIVSTFPAENIIKSDNYEANANAGELLSQQQKQQQNPKKSDSVDEIPNITVTPTKSSHMSRIPSLKTVDKRNRNASSASFERVSSTVSRTRGRSNERKEKQRQSPVPSSSKSRSKQRKQSSSSDVARHVSRSPIRVVE